MHFQKKVKAGVLLYALLMAAVFSLILQFYIHRQISNHHIYQASKASTQAYAMVLLTLDNLPQPTPEKIEQTDQLHFSTGITRYQQNEKEIRITVILQTGETFTYRFASPSQKD